MENHKSVVTKARFSLRATEFLDGEEVFNNLLDIVEKLNDFFGQYWSETGK